MRGILFDLDGVLYNSGTLIPGAPEALAWVESQNIPYLYLTNTTSRSRAVLAGKLAAFGFPASVARILSPAAAAADWLLANRACNIALFLRPSTQTEFEGLPLVPGDAERGADWVVVGDLGHHWDFRTLNRAFRLLHYNPHAVLIGLGRTRYWRAEDGISLDVAPFVAALEHASGRRAMVFGKPEPAFFQAAANRLELPAGEVVMIGDDIEADVGGALAAGLAGVMVRTGKFRPVDLEGPVHPTAVLDSIAALPAWWNATS